MKWRDLKNETMTPDAQARAAAGTAELLARRLWWPLVWRSTLEDCQHWRDAHRDKLAEVLDAFDDAQALASKWEGLWMDAMKLSERWEASHERTVDAAEKRYADLLTKYQQLRLQGAVDVVPVTPPPRAEQDLCVRAINEKCRGLPPAVRTGMLTQLAADRAALMSDVEILSRITNGVPADEAVTVV